MKQIFTFRPKIKKQPVDEMLLCQFTIRCSELFHINLRKPSIRLPDI